MKLARTSPFEPLWRARATAVGSQFGMGVPSRCDAASVEDGRAATLGIADVSGVPRATIKGERGAAAIAENGVPNPEAWYEAVPLDAWSFVARTGKRELWVEGPLHWTELRSASTITHAREEASLLLTGAHVADFLAEGVGIPIELGTSRLYLTEVLKISAMVLPRSRAGVTSVQIWFDPTYALYAGEVLSRIAADYGGGWVGTSALEGQGLLPVWN